MEDKIDGIKDDVSSINVTLSAQHVSLKEHMRRSDLLENRIMPIEKHVYIMQGIGKFLGALAVVAGIIEGFTILLEYLKK